MHTGTQTGVASWWLRISQAWFDQRMRSFRKDPTVTLAE